VEEVGVGVRTRTCTNNEEVRCLLHQTLALANTRTVVALRVHHVTRFDPNENPLLHMYRPMSTSVAQMLYIRLVSSWRKKL